jgi:hypothetical protein
MGVDDTIIEALETDNLALQNMSGGKYVQVGARHPTGLDRMGGRKPIQAASPSDHLG